MNKTTTMLIGRWIALSIITALSVPTLMVWSIGMAEVLGVRL